MLALRVVISAETVLLLALSCHWILWRIRIPNKHINSLLSLFLVVWCSSVGMLWDSNMSLFFLGGVFLPFWFFYFSVLYWSAALCYVITYSAMEGDSPTLSLARYLHRKGDEGVCHEEIEEFFRERPFIGARVRALVTDRILIEGSNGYRLRSGKYLFFHTILLYRRLVFGRVSSGG